jgi:hypothetical protein
MDAPDVTGLTRKKSNLVGLRQLSPYLVHKSRNQLRQHRVQERSEYLHYLTFFN